MVESIYEIFTNLVMIQSLFTVAAIAFSAVIISFAGGEFRQIGVFRVGVLGAFFQVLFLFVTIFLLYFDLRVISLCLQTLFLVCNAAFTLSSIRLGYAFLGYGYFLASLLCCVIAFIVLLQVLRRLKYITFVTNNPSVSR
jgi:uncharacterized membrane protein